MKRTFSIWWGIFTLWWTTQPKPSHISTFLINDPKLGDDARMMLNLLLYYRAVDYIKTRKNHQRHRSMKT